VLSSQVDRAMLIEGVVSRAPCRSFSGSGHGSWTTARRDAMLFVESAVTKHPPSALTPAQLDELRERLVARAGEAQQGLMASSDDARPVDIELSIGRLSRVDAMQHQQVARARQRSVGVLLQQVNAALARVADGSYGLCLECDEPIGYPRLRARPETPLCLRCQSVREG
jgi:DnaK suppressor protein